MEHFNRDNPGEVDSCASSAYSSDSFEKPADSAYARSTASTHSRTAASAPSYMRASVVTARKPVLLKLTPRTNGQVQPTTPPPKQPPARGLLTIAIAASPDLSSVSYIEMMLKRGSYSEIVIIGTTAHEEKVKQLKMNVYALLGKLGKEVGVQVVLQANWTEVDLSTAISNATESGETIHGVICSPAYEESRLSAKDILALDEEQLESSWKSTVGFIHRVAKSALPHFRSNGLVQGGIDHVQAGVRDLFLVTSPTNRTSTPSSTISLNQSTCDHLIRLLADANSAKGIIVDYAKNTLIPEPESSEINGAGVSAQPAMVDSDLDFAIGESPTKLWNMWALQDELVAGV